MRRLRPLTEAECYARCYGEFEVAVRIVDVDPKGRPAAPTLSGEAVRLLFEGALDAREPDAGAEAA